ncbi:MAG: hypothetical protein AUI15_19080 [Actinobacteria bacterium 13_2_20CM_2_66_6]|nr:MAG: hypothetical protein AUI15_19080 [Actinobacteria bacterium 13_2_20CM_2_66_6]
MMPARKGTLCITNRSSSGQTSFTFVPIRFSYSRVASGRLVRMVVFIGWSPEPQSTAVQASFISTIHSASERSPPGWRRK